MTCGWLLRIRRALLIRLGTIEPESGERYQVLFERMKRTYLDLLTQTRDLLDAKPEPRKREPL